MDFENLNLDELLSSSTESVSTDNTSIGKMFTNAEVEVTVVDKSDTVAEPENSVEDTNLSETTEDTEWTKENWLEHNKKQAMSKLEEYEACEKNLAKLDGEMTLLNQELEGLISKIKLDNKDLIDKINAKSNEIDAIKSEQDKIKSELVPLQREVYLVDNTDKTLKYNKVQATYVAATEKNQFDLKLFREEQADFWKTNLDILKPYSKITNVSDYVKITVSKK
jgi:predicted  nucleic acid-binding Zn-ribbon protein